MPVVALSQLNRSLEQRADNARSTPTCVIASIEQDADLIMFIAVMSLSRNKADLKGIAEIIIVNNVTARSAPCD